MSKLKFLNFVFILVCCLVYTSHCLARDYTDFEREYYIENIKKYTEEIKQNPNEALLYGARGEAYYELGAYEQAIDDFTKSIALDNNNISASSSYIYRAKAYKYIKKIIWHCKILIKLLN